MPKKPKPKKQPNQQTQTPAVKGHFTLKEILPLTHNQERTFDAYDANKNLILHGFAGTGKSFISLYLALEEILPGDSKYDKIIIVRSAVPSRELGFLKGGLAEKTEIYEEPYREICDTLFGRGDGYDVLKAKRLIEFTTTSFLRGLTFNNAIVIVDEIQNLSFEESDTVITRLGDNSRVIFCGDFRQTDFKHDYEKRGLHKFLDILKGVENFKQIEFTKEDIVRSGIVKDYIIERSRLEDLNGG